MAYNIIVNGANYRVNEYKGFETFDEKTQTLYFESLNTISLYDLDKNYKLMEKIGNKYKKDSLRIFEVTEAMKEVLKGKGLKEVSVEFAGLSKRKSTYTFCVMHKVKDNTKS